MPVEQIKIMRACISDTMPDWHRNLFMLIGKLWVYVRYLSKESEATLCEALTPHHASATGHPPGRFKIPSLRACWKAVGVRPLSFERE